ncbi:MAG TPA: hypothetical protein VJR89_24390, partial [Polyangiales bacterium]|nr:hypothetical protein [Polyangiales bacterium]
MSDDRRRRRDTPSGMGPVRGQAPRGAGLSGDLPAGSRYVKPEKHEPPVSAQHDAAARARHPAAQRGADPHAHTERGPWDAADTPSRPAVVEP